MRLTDKLQNAKRAVEAAMYEQMQRDNARCVGAGARYYGPRSPKRGIARLREGAKLSV